MTQNKKIAIISAMWHDDIVENAEQSFIKTLQDKGYESSGIDVIKVPGSLEIPLIGQQCLNGDYDLAVGIGLIVNGLIYRHDFVGQEVVRGIVDVSLRTNKPFLSVVLTPQTFQEHEPLNRKYMADHFVIKGREAAEAADRMLALYTASAQLKAA